MNALTGGDIGLGIFSAFQAGQQARQQTDGRNALGAYAANPTREGLGQLAQYQPEFAMQERGRFDQREQAEATQQREQLPIMGRLLQGARDEGTYQQALQMAQRAGMDTSTAPRNFDQQWVQSTLTLVEALQTPQGQEALSVAGKAATDMGFRPGTPEFSAKVTELYNAEHTRTIAYQPGGNVLSYNTATGQATPLVQGEAAPAQDGAPSPGTVEDGYRFKGGNPADPASWEQVAAGGGGSNVTSGFPGR